MLQLAVRAMASRDSVWPFLQDEAVLVVVELEEVDFTAQKSSP